MLLSRSIIARARAVAGLCGSPAAKPRGLVFRELPSLGYLSQRRCRFRAPFLVSLWFISVFFPHADFNLKRHVRLGFATHPFHIVVILFRIVANNSLLGVLLLFHIPAFDTHELGGFSQPHVQYSRHAGLPTYRIAALLAITNHPPAQAPPPSPRKPA